MAIKTIITSILAKTVDNKPLSHRFAIKRKRVNYPAKRFYRRDLGIEFKSSMEANVYRFYTQKCKGIIIEYEPEIFYYPTKGDLVLNAHTYKASYFNPLQIKGYCPDFKITYGHFTWYVEVKGKMDRLSIEKARLFKKFYPHLKLYFITPKEYNLIKYFYSKSIRGWE